ncbi:FtsX-like permease family protein [Corynebacteriaceae bacterium 7-707]
MSRAARTLLRLSLRGLRAHRARLVLTILAVALSTAFIAGTALLSSALGESVDRLTASDYSHADVIVRPADGHRVIPDRVRDRIVDHPLVDRVTVDDRRSVVLSRGPSADGPTVDTGGMPVRPTPFYDADHALDPGTRLVAGSPPSPGEVVLTASAAESTGLSVGDTVTVTGPAEGLTLTVSGLSAGSDDGTGAIRLSLDTGDYRETFAPDGPPGLALRTTPGTAAETAATALEEELSGTPDHPALSVRTAAEVEEADSAVLDTGVGYLRYILGAFGVIALVVAMFIIANTFAMTVGQRLRDYALLRALGMSARQVSTSVLCEALVTGGFGSALGVAAGLGLVTAGTRLVPDTGPLTAEVPAGDPTLLATAVLLPWIVGTVTTILAAWGPAGRAASVPPAGTAPAAATGTGAALRRRSLSGVVTGLTGAAAATAAALDPGWGTPARAAACGAGVLLALTGVYLVSPAVSRIVLPPLGRLFSLPLGRSFRTAGTLAVRTTRRAPRRTAGTAFALTLGMCLVTVTGMAGASTVASLRQAVDTEVSADLVVAAPGGAVDVPVPGSTVDEVREAPGVGATFTLGKALAVVGDDPQQGLPLVTVSNGDPSDVLDVGEKHGDLDIGTDDGITMSSSYAAAHGWEIGDPVPVAAQGQGRAVELPLTGTYGHSRILGDVVIGASAFWRLAPGAQGGTGHRVMALLVDGDGTRSQEQLAEGLDGLLGDSAEVTVQTPAEFAGEQSVLVERIVLALYALTALAVLVAVMGVVNTLALSVVERRREIGMLRAVGMGRAQVRRMVVVESLQTTVYGAALGTLLGLGAGWALLGVLSDVGLSTLAVPWGLVAGVLVASIPLGVLAALAPAVRAARIPPLQASQP